MNMAKREKISMNEIDGIESGPVDGTTIVEREIVEDRS